MKWKWVRNRTIKRRAHCTCSQGPHTFQHDKLTTIKVKSMFLRPLSLSWLIEDYERSTKRSKTVLWSLVCNQRVATCYLPSRRYAWYQWLTCNVHPEGDKIFIYGCSCNQANGQNKYWPDFHIPYSVRWCVPVPGPNIYMLVNIGCACYLWRLSETGND